MVYQSFEGCAPKQNPRVSLNFLTDIVQFCSRIIRLVINILYVYRFLTAIHGFRLREQDEDNRFSKIRAPYMCATRHHLSVEPDVIQLHKDLRKLIYRFKLEVRYIAHTIQHYPHLLFQTVPLLESSIRKLQCSLDDLEMAATFDGQTEIQPGNACYSKEKSKIKSKRRSRNNNNNRSSLHPKKLPSYHTVASTTESVSSRVHSKARKTILKDDSSSTLTQKSIPQVSGRLRRLEADEEQVYLIARNIHLALHTLMINAKLVHLTTKHGIKAGVSTLLFPFIYDIGKKCCLAFYYLQLLSKYISYRAVQTEHRPMPDLTDIHVNFYPANRNVITEANQFLVDNFAKTVKKQHVRFNVAAQQCLPPSILTRRFSQLKK